MVNESTINVLKELIRRLEAEKREIERQQDGLAMALRHLEDLGEPSTPTLQKKREEGRGKDLREAMVEILTAADGPLSRQEIHDRLAEQGIYVGGRDPVNNVGARLSIDPRFENVERGKWDLALSSSSLDSEEPDDSAGESEKELEEEEDSIAW